MLYLTAGHHFKDPGAVANGYQENNLNIELRDLITKELKEKYPDVKFWTDKDTSTLSQVILEIKPQVTSKDYWVEIHFDSSERKAATGTTALVANNSREKSRSLASALASLTSETLGITNRGVKSESESNRGKLAMLHTSASSVLLEIAFISNSSDLQKYQKEKKCLAEVIANKIANTI